MIRIVILLFCLTQIQVISAQKSKWKLVWHDEFNYTGLPSDKKWSFETRGNASGWGNNEAQYYTAFDTANAYVSNGTLKIKALVEKIENKEYTSARLSTDGKKFFQYGKIEVRAKLPSGRGTWPAIWMLGSNIKSVQWPDCGEIDIMEHVGYDKDSVFGTIHSGAYNHIKGTQRGKKIFISQPYESFHVFGIEWTKESIVFTLDGKKYHSFANEHKTDAEWPFNQPCFLILNLAIGGGLGGKYGIDQSIFPATMEVDYVRVYKAK